MREGKDYLGDVIYALAVVLGIFAIVGRIILIICGN
jgi:hypothetical protein